MTVVNVCEFDACPDHDGPCIPWRSTLVWHCSNRRPECGPGHPCHPMTCNWTKESD